MYAAPPSPVAQLPYPQFPSSRSRSNSPVHSGKSGFAFPPLSSATPPLASNSYASSSLSTFNGLDEPLPPPASTSRFHEALAALPATLQRRPRSRSSTSSTGSTSTFRFPPDSASPTGTQSFDGLQRELGHGESGATGATTEREVDIRRRRGSFEAYAGGETTLPASVYDDSPQQGDSGLAKSGGMFGGIRRNLQDYAVGSPGGVENESTGYEREYRNRMTGSSSAEASFDTSYDSDANLDFLLSPPPHVVALAAANNRQYTEATIKGKEKGRDRTFPAPLLLKGDRPFGINGSPANTSPLVIARNYSPSIESPATTPLSTPSRSVLNLSTSTGTPPPPNALALATGPITAAESYPNPSFRRHRYQNSSTSSNSYSHSPHPSGSSAPISSSPVIGGTSTLGYTSSHSHSTSIPSIATPVEPPVAPQALLLYILSLRSTSTPASLAQSQGSSRSATTPFSSVSQHARVRSGGSGNSDHDEEDSPTRSMNAGRLDTVDLSHKRIAEVPQEVIDELRDEVEKLALGYNLLRDLPPGFAALGSRLRYLNVRVNMLTVFPQVLCEMPSLEILDISRNKIKRLPSNPGTLLNLKVFSIAKNRVKRLPIYFAQMHQLKVLKLDHNPLEWPPKDVTTFPMADLSSSVNGTESESRRTGSSSSSKVEDAEEMQRWLPNLVKWIRENAASADRRVRPSVSTTEISDDERERRQGSEASSTRHIGMTRTESGRLIVSPASQSIATFPTNGSAPRLRDLTSPSTPLFESPPPTARPFHDSDRSPRQSQHIRNASHSTTQSDQRPALRSKKSLPDLRQSHADILTERRSGPTFDSPIEPIPAVRRLREEIVGTSNSAPITASSSRASTPTQANPTISNLNIPRTSRLPLRDQSTEAEDEQESDRVDSNRTGAVQYDRNSGAYFRRLSMLPTSTISKTVPIALLQYVDAIRGILFALSQVYSALRQFMVFASQDRLPVTLSRALGQADRTMSSLINALDRFDSLSRRGTPETSVVRDVFVKCKENVGVFSKIMTALGTSLKTLVATADVRYTRTLLLMLYGSMGEIANSWNGVSTLLQEMEETDGSSLANLVLQPPTPSPTASTGPPSRPGIGPLYRARSKTRRHAGSFSVEDVQLGAVLPPAAVTPPPGVPSLPAAFIDLNLAATNAMEGMQTSTVKPQAVGANKNRSFGPNHITLPSSLNYREDTMDALELPTPNGGPGISTLWGASLRTNGDASSGMDSPSVELGSSTRGNGRFLESTRSASGSNGATAMAIASADRKFLSMVDSTTGIAFDIYALLLSSLDTSSTGVTDSNGTESNALALIRELGGRRTKELTDLCGKGVSITEGLRVALERVRANGGAGEEGLSFTREEAKRLGDESYAFVQTVIRFAKLVKAISLEHGFAPKIRDGVGQLTIATREFAKHLSNSVTSFRPTAPPSSSSSSSSLPTSGSGGVKDRSQ